MNLKHLRYFWAVARFDGVTRAAHKLHLTPQTLSGQIAELQEQLGVELLRPAGRRLELTDAGRVAYSYADEIFALADELRGQLQGLPTGGRVEVFRVGITDGVPRSLVHRLLAPLVDTAQRRLTCSHEHLEVLLADLALHRLDLIIADRPVPDGSSVKAFNHVLGDTAIGLFAAATHAAALRRGFPRSLQGQPLLLPGRDSAIHGQVRDWFDARRVVPRHVAEFDDSGLMKTFGAAGPGAFPAPLAVRAEIERLYDVALIGVLTGIKDRYYAISTERRATHPCVVEVLARGGRLLAEAPMRPAAKTSPRTRSRSVARR